LGKFKNIQTNKTYRYTGKNTNWTIKNNNTIYTIQYNTGITQKLFLISISVSDVRSEM